MKDRSQLLVEEFHEAFGLEHPATPRHLTAKAAKLRIKLMREELQEVEDAFTDFEDDESGRKDYEGHFADIAGELADLLYVTLGTVVEMGFDGLDVVDAIHQANMRKLWTDAEVDAALKMDTSDWNDRLWIGDNVGHDQWVVLNVDGKIMKPPSFRKADINGALSL